MPRTQSVTHHQIYLLGRRIQQGVAVLVQDDRNEVAPVVVSMLKAKSEACLPGTAASQQGPRTGNIPAAVLAKEAVYNAAGVGAYGLHDYIDFKQWFQSTLLQVCLCGLAVSHPLCPCLAVTLMNIAPLTVHTCFLDKCNFSRRACRGMQDSPFGG